jgi:hypothetical protein
VDIAKVYERVAMTAATNAAAADENVCTRTREFAIPDGVVFSSHNTISPSPGGRNSGRKKSPPGYIAPATFGGWVEIALSKDDSATEVVSTGTQLRELPRKKARASPPTATTADNQQAAALPVAIYASRPGTRGVLRPDDFSEDNEFGSSDVFCPQRLEVRTQDLPNTQYFGGAQALYDLHLGQPEFGSFSKEI